MTDLWSIVFEFLIVIWGLAVTFFVTKIISISHKVCEILKILQAYVTQHDTDVKAFNSRLTIIELRQKDIQKDISEACEFVKEKPE